MNKKIVRLFCRETTFSETDIFFDGRSINSKSMLKLKGVLSLAFKKTCVLELQGSLSLRRGL